MDVQLCMWEQCYRCVVVAVTNTTLCCFLFSSCIGIWQLVQQQYWFVLQIYIFYCVVLWYEFYHIISIVVVFVVLMATYLSVCINSSMFSLMPSSTNWWILSTYAFHVVWQYLYMCQINDCIFHKTFFFVHYSFYI